MLHTSYVNDSKAGASLAPAVRTATAAGTGIDLKDFRSAIAVFHCGTFGDTQSGSVYIEAELQDSDDNSTFAAVADANLAFPSGKSARTGTATGTFFQSKTTGAADAAGLYEVGYKGLKRYLRVNVRYTGTHSIGTPVCAQVRLGNADVKPVQ
jgi:hypothetical protein